MSTNRGVVMFAMLEHGHVKRLLPLIEGLRKLDRTVHVFAPERFRSEIERAGGHHVDIFRGRPLESIDATSVPIPCRYISFAACCADAVTAEVAALDPGLVVHDTFAVIGAVVARRLRLPRVNVCAGHNHAPLPTLAELSRDPRVSVSDVCHRAVEILRKRGDLPDASPFAYVTALSRELNIYCEPPAFLHEDERQVFQPLVFAGSLSTETIEQSPPSTHPFGPGGEDDLCIYVCFGTVMWRYYAGAAEATLHAVAEAVAKMPRARALISLGGEVRRDLATRLQRSNVRVENYVNQWDVLSKASVFITHHGLNSTHEAVFHQVPMISYPFFADQPGLARRCQALGLAVPLATEPRGPVTVDDVRAALLRVARERSWFESNLRQARAWELDTIERRDQVIARMVALMG